MVPELRRQMLQEKAVPVMEMLHAWMIAKRNLVAEGDQLLAERWITA